MLGDWPRVFTGPDSPSGYRIFSFAWSMNEMANAPLLNNEALLGSAPHYQRNLQPFQCVAKTQQARMPGAALRKALKQEDRQIRAPPVTCSAVSGQTSILDADAVVMHAGPEVKAILFDMVNDIWP